MQQKFKELCNSYENFVDQFNKFSKSFQEGAVRTEDLCSEVVEEVVSVERECGVQRTAKMRAQKGQQIKKGLRQEEIQEEISDNDVVQTIEIKDAELKVPSKG